MRQSENLPEAPIRKFTGFHNPEYKKKCTVLEGQFCLCATLWGAARKMWGCRKKLPFLSCRQVVNKKIKTA